MRCVADSLSSTLKLRKRSNFVDDADRTVSTEVLAAELELEGEGTELFVNEGNADSSLNGYARYQPHREAAVSHAVWYSVWRLHAAQKPREKIQR